MHELLPTIVDLDKWYTDWPKLQLITVVDSARKCGAFLLILVNSSYYFTPISGKLLLRRRPMSHRNSKASPARDINLGNWL